MTTPLGRGQPEWSPPAPSSSCRVLVLDRAPAVRRTLATHLARLGVSESEVGFEGDPRAALARFHADTPALVLVEIDDMGAELVEEMLADAPDSRVVILTSSPRDDPDVRRAIRAGAFAVLEKPLRLSNVRQLLLEIEQEDGGVERYR